MSGFSYIEKIKRNLNFLFQKKCDFAFSVMDKPKTIVFKLIAPLLHLNHPLFPGYVAKSPFGIFNYHLTDADKSLLIKQFNDSSNDFFINCELDESLYFNNENHKAISALYSMGSTGTLGQTNDSDIDIWICLELSFSPQEKALLKEKMQILESWAKSLNVSLHLYLVDVERFKKNHHDCLTQENCGSAQHVLLLEEFYRSAFRLAGKWLIWYLVPLNLTFNNKRYSSYDLFVCEFIHQEKLNLEEWFDFGELQHLPQQEYFGSCLWQLYQCIDSPFKSTLKTLLLESYVMRKTPFFIAFDVLNKIQSDEIEQYHYLDAYVMLFEAIQTYLNEIKDNIRLQIAQHCFYIKIMPHHDKLKLPAWKQILIDNYLSKWHWSDLVIQRFEQIQSWSIVDLFHLDDVILKTIMSSYKKLLEFARIHNIESVINLTDLSILTRKLYVVYEESPQKIKRINRAFISTLSQRALTFIFVPKHSTSLSGWYLYNQPPQIPQLIESPCIYYSERIVKMIAWTYFNSVLDDKTALFCFHKGKITTDFIYYIYQQLVVNISKNESVEDELLLNPSEVTEVVIFINSEVLKFDLDPYLKDQIEMQFDTRFIQEIDIIYKNSWDELKHFYFSGDMALLDALRIFVNKFQKNGQFPRSLKVVSVPHLFKSEIEKKVTQFFTQAIHYRLEDNLTQKARFMPIRLNGQSWYLFFERFGISVHQFDNKLALFDAVTTNKMKGKVRDIHEVRDVLPHEIDAFAKEGAMQLFFHDHKEGFDLYILNEKNQVEIYRNCHANKELMIQEVTQFYLLTSERSGSKTTLKGLFTVPQFYQIISIDHENQMILPYHLC